MMTNMTMKMHHLKYQTDDVSARLGAAQVGPLHGSLRCNTNSTAHARSPKPGSGDVVLELLQLCGRLHQFAFRISGKRLVRRCQPMPDLGESHHVDHCADSVSRL